MLILRLTPADFTVMVQFLRDMTVGHRNVPLRQRPLSLAVLQQYHDTLSNSRLNAWHRRDRRRLYALRLTLPVALALYYELRSQPTTDLETHLLGLLDKAMVDYREGGEAKPISHYLSTTIPHDYPTGVIAPPA